MEVRSREPQVVRPSEGKRTDSEPVLRQTLYTTIATWVVTGVLGLVPLPISPLVTTGLIAAVAVAAPIVLGFLARRVAWSPATVHELLDQVVAAEAQQFGGEIGEAVGGVIGSWVQPTSANSNATGATISGGNLPPGSTWPAQGVNPSTGNRPPEDPPSSPAPNPDPTAHARRPEPGSYRLGDSNPRTERIRRDDTGGQR